MAPFLAFLSSSLRITVEFPGFLAANPPLSPPYPPLSPPPPYPPLLPPPKPPLLPPPKPPAGLSLWAALSNLIDLPSKYEPLRVL